MDSASHLQLILKTLPDKPGVYQYYDVEGKILYVGKAKSLKKRVNSYFTKERFESGRTRVLVSKIADIKTIIVDSELDALLLENNLIKQLQPRFNVLLKDDKSFPWIVIKNEPFPRIFPTRRKISDGSEYFGPYPSVKVMRTLLDTIKQLYPRRTCNLNLTEKNIAAGKFKVCLEYHIHNCKGPCEGHQSQAEYDEMIAEIRQFIKGKLNDLVGMLKNRMMEHATAFEFEKAQVIKERIELIEKYKSKSTIVNPAIKNVDVFSFHQDETIAHVNYLKVIDGCIVQGHTIELRKKLDESPEELLAIAIAEMRIQFESDSKEAIVPFLPDIETDSIHFTIPQRGDKKQLLELSERNLWQYIKDKQKQIELIDPERHTKRVLETLKKDLRLPELPRHIECFDNSNFQGAYPVSAMVCFKDAKPSKQDYRHYNVKTVEGPNDFATMEEVIYRRYSHLLENSEPLPQLIVIDGGKGQLSAALQSLEKLGLRGKISIIGIAKRLEEIYFPDDSIPLYIDKKSESLKVIQQLRNEAHRFGITHHRKRREKGTIKTELSEIKGIGDSTASELLRAFKSVKKIKTLGLNELTEKIGLAKAQLVYQHFQQEHASK
ncbi:MAG: excinuclease ABC subunit UvrC [Flavobacteriales bacterium]